MAEGEQDTGEDSPVRVVKLRLPVTLLRAMDQVILTSRGAYLDRNEFVTEAIWDRLAEERQQGLSRVAEARQVTSSLPATMSGSESPARLTPVDPWPLPAAARSEGATLPAVDLTGNNFGLHNRDLPTLWAVADLCLQTTDGPVAWRTHSEELRSRVQQAAVELRQRDLSDKPVIPAATSFPKPGPKARASEDRFLSTAIGTPRGTASQGPAFLLRLTGADPEDAAVIAPTLSARPLLRELLDAGLGPVLPQPPEATLRWLQHVRDVAADEFKAWLAVLVRVADRPTRAELIAAFPQWPGSRADTNCMGYIARSREWGLVTPALEQGGRYQLTDLGQRVSTQGENL